jgi:hypothetical protein
MGVKLGFLALREEHRPIMFENKAMGIFGSKKEDVRREW